MPVCFRSHTLGVQSLAFVGFRGQAFGFKRSSIPEWSRSPLSGHHCQVGEPRQHPVSWAPFAGWGCLMWHTSLSLSDSTCLDAFWVATDINVRSLSEMYTHWATSAPAVLCQSCPSAPQDKKTTTRVEDQRRVLSQPDATCNRYMGPPENLANTYGFGSGCAKTKMSHVLRIHSDRLPRDPMPFFLGGPGGGVGVLIHPRQPLLTWWPSRAYFPN